ncbi:MAG: 2-oxoacid:ferredoxin oxidoreductase subunit beta, partial [Opitutae bacterium]|nr:2-oxoacid:ferredoxin oxidoreductase subunit beta [Opitutae bacterium]
KTSNPAYPALLSQLNYPAFPTPFGIFRQLEGRETYEDAVTQQLEVSHSKQGEGDLQALLTGSDSWVVE